MQEELDEIKVAISDGDIVGISDGLADLMYVLCGSILEFGLEKKFNQIFNEVQRSNMSKACCSEKEAIETLLHYKEKDGTEGYYERIADKWIVYRSGDNKVLKSINYSKADLDRILKSK
jgi:predicted HAD superfamily Cof-like phosphohydrolase